MSRKKIDLTLANEAWLKTHLGQRYDRDTSDYQTWKQKDRDKAILALAQRYFLDKALDLSVQMVSVDDRPLAVNIRVTDQLSAKDLNRIMNSEIHLDEKVVTFMRLEGDTYSEGGFYMGEYSSTEYGCLRIVYA